MVNVSHHAIYRFVQRHYKRGLGAKRVTKAEVREAKETLQRWFENSIPLDTNRYLYQDFVLVCKGNTIITVYQKYFIRKD